MTNKEIIAMLEQLQLDINSFAFVTEDYPYEDVVRQQDIEDEINERINKLKGEDHD